MIEDANGNSDKEKESISVSLNTGASPANGCWVNRVNWGCTNMTVTSVTVGNDNITPNATTRPNSRSKAFTQLFWSTTNLTGSQTITITFNSIPRFMTCGGDALTPVDQTTPKEAVNSVESSASTISISLAEGNSSSFGLDGMHDHGTSMIRTSSSNYQRSNSVESTHEHSSSLVGAAPTMGCTSFSNNKDGDSFADSGLALKAKSRRWVSEIENMEISMGSINVANRAILFLYQESGEVEALGVGT